MEKTRRFRSGFFLPPFFFLFFSCVSLRFVIRSCCRSLTPPSSRALLNGCRVWGRSAVQKKPRRHSSHSFPASRKREGRTEADKKKHTQNNVENINRKEISRNCRGEWKKKLAAAERIQPRCRAKLFLLPLGRGAAYIREPRFAVCAPRVRVGASCLLLIFWAKEKKDEKRLKWTDFCLLIPWNLSLSSCSKDVFL